MSDASNAPDEATWPTWFDADKHVAREGGIFEAATGVVLDENGEPRSLAVRSLRAEAAAEAAAAPTPPKRGRDTRQILEAAAIAGGADAPKE